MRVADLLKTATIGVSSNKSRALLTMLGIIIGVGSVVLMTGVGKSMEGVILGQISILGPKTMALWPGNQGPESGASSLRPDFDSLKIDDAEAMAELTTITSIAPLIMVPGNARYGGENSDPRIIGAAPGYYLNQNVDVSQGRLHDDNDEHAQRAVALIGSDIYEDLFFGRTAIGKRIDLAGRKFTVIGVLKPVGTQFFQNMDERIIMPLSLAKIITNRNYYDAITFQAIDNPELALKDVESLMRQRHQIKVPKNGSNENDDFLIRTAEQAQSILGAVSLGLTLFITMVAGISLIVGGIGIMNIMLVAITERTREIGLRKAVGAKPRDILWQFLVEAVYLTMLGGIIGIIFGIFLAYLIALVVNQYLDRYVFDIQLSAILIALFVAGATGLLFGIEPARRAARLNPIEALHYE